MTFEVFPKLNVFLKILGFKGSYHSLFSRFVLAKGKIKDVIEIKNRSSFCLQGDFGCQTQQNLIYLAIVALRDFLDSRGKESSMLQGLHIEVQKGIPKGAGLGGGSADAGMCLRKINEFFDLGLSVDELMFIGAKVGADVSFFASGFESANVSGVGEIVEKFDEEEYDFEILLPGVFCDTKVVYSKYDEMLQKGALSLSPFFKEGKKASYEFLSYERGFLNDLFFPALEAYPRLRGIHQELGKEWFFSGSGSSFFRLKEHH